MTLTSSLALNSRSRNVLKTQRRSSLAICGWPPQPCPSSTSGPGKSGKSIKSIADNPSRHIAGQSSKSNTGSYQTVSSATHQTFLDTVDHRLSHLLPSLALGAGVSIRVATRRVSLMENMMATVAAWPGSWQSLRRTESPMDELPANLANTASDSSVPAQYVVLAFRTPISSRSIFACPV